MAELAVLYLVGVMLAVLLAIVWLVLPFAVFGIKPLLRQVLEEQRKQTELLAQIAGSVR